MRWWSPHYVYVPAAFAMMLLAEIADRSERGLMAGRAAAALLALLTVFDGRKYANDRTLWTPEVQARPSCREAQFYLGEIEREARRWDSAAARYEAALGPNDRVLAYVDRAAVLQNLGTVRLEQRRFEDARAAFGAALEGTKNEEARRELVHNLAALALQSGDAAEADRLLAPETARPDAHPASIQVRAIALEKLGRSREAAELRERLGR
jgi:tetratricopeptide (TPR) repeat protein